MWIGGFIILKRLFQTGSSVTIEDFASLRINGPYSLLKLGPDFAIIRVANTRLRRQVKI